jgi:teichuronic acid biosynthesis glycosyltransferase TuaG
MIKFSVIIPVYNSSSYIIDVLNCLANQTLKPHEVIIINDSSSDDSLILITEFIESNSNILNYNLFNLKSNKGVSFCRNLGLENSTGDYIAFLDADDFWHHDKLKIMSDLIISKSPVLIGHMYSEKKIKIENLNFDITKVVKFSLSKLLFRNVFQTSSVVIDKNINLRFDEELSYCEDYDLFLRITSNYSRIYFYNEKLTYLGRPQLSQGGLSGNKIKMRIGEIKAISKTLKNLKINFLLPFFVFYSILKYIIKIFR